MKKVLIILLVIAFGAGIYANFGMNKSMDDTGSVADEATESNEAAAEPERTEEETTEEAATEPEAEEELLTFNQESLDTAYTEAVADDEALIIDVVVPSYYSDSFIDALSEQFGSDQIEFNRVDLESATPDFEVISVNANSDAVIMDALQISDYNSEVLSDRDVDRLTSAYMNLYENGRVVYILGNPDVHQEEQLADVLEEESDYFTSSDFYYIDNQNVSVDGDFYDYDADEMTSAAEMQIVQNIYAFIVE